MNKLEQYEELERTMRDVTRFADTLPRRLSQVVLAVFMQHYQSTDAPTAAVAAFLMVVPFLFWMARSMAAFHLHDPAVAAYVPGTVMLPRPRPVTARRRPMTARAPVFRDCAEVAVASEAMRLAGSVAEGQAAVRRAIEELLASNLAPDATVQEQAELRRTFEELLSYEPAPGASIQDQAAPPTSGSDVQEQIEPARESEASATPRPTPEAAAQAQTEPTRGTEVVPSSRPTLELVPGSDAQDQDATMAEAEAMPSPEPASGTRARHSSRVRPELSLQIDAPTQDELRSEYEALHSSDAASGASSHTLDHEPVENIGVVPLSGLAA